MSFLFSPVTINNTISDKKTIISVTKESKKIIKFLICYKGLLIHGFRKSVPVIIYALVARIYNNFEQNKS